MYAVTAPKTSADLWMLSLSGDRKSSPLLHAPFVESHGQISPDGKWLAYFSNETGRTEVYVQSFPAEKGGRWQVSTNGGFTPKWSKDGKELFYLSPDNQIMSSQVRLVPTFEANAAKPLFAIHPFAVPRIAGGYMDTFAPAPDGQHFAVHAPLYSSRDITVVLNWPLLLNQKSH